MRLVPLLSVHRRRLCTAALKLKNLCYRHRPRALAAAELAVTDYLHSTRSVPFPHAELIASNSPLSLSSFLSQIPFPPDIPPSDIPRTIRRFLRYRPISEFDFFFESIGLPPSLTPSPSSLPLFLSDRAPLLSAVSALVSFGFPWTLLGILYQHNPSIFATGEKFLLDRLRSFESFGLRRICVIGICLAFPHVLTGEDPEIDLLFRDLKCVFLDFELDVDNVDNVDVFYKICRGIRAFYDAGSEKGAMGELMGSNRRVFLDLEESEIAQKLNFFRGLGMEDVESGVFVLGNAEVLDLDLDNPDISMPEYLRHVGFGDEEVVSLSRKYPYVMGKNRLGNLPGIARAMGIHNWFLGKIVGGHIRFLSPDYAYVSSYDEMAENEFLNGMEKVKSMKKIEFVDVKMEFLLGIGFGENRFTARAVGLINGTRKQLQERFDCLLGMGIEYTVLCRIINASPKLLNQSADMLQAKVSYLLNDLGYPLEYLGNFPAFLCFDLENRIKPRFRVLNWLKEKGLLSKHFSPATVLANSEKRFIINLLGIHPAAPKQWLEIFSSRIDYCGNQRVLFSSTLSNPNVKEAAINGS